MDFDEGKFIRNKYLRWYAAITAAADINGYTEKHHIVPRSMGGGNDSSNLVALSPRKHFLAHWILTKCTLGAYRRKMLNALNCMRWSKGRKLSAWQYQVARNAASERMRNVRRPDDVKARISASHIGLRHPPDVIEKIAFKKRGQKSSLETRKKVSASLIGNTRCVGNKATDETKQLMSVAHLSSDKPQSNNVIGLKGVHFHKQAKKWRSTIVINKQKTDLGLFDCPAAARIAYIIAVDMRLSSLSNEA